MKKLLKGTILSLIFLFVLSVCFGCGAEPKDPHYGIDEADFDSYSYDYGDFLQGSTVVFLDTYTSYRLFCNKEKKSADEYLSQWGVEDYNFGAAPYFEKLNSYAESYFRNSVLIVIHSAESSGSHQLSVKKLLYSDSEAQVVLERRVPGPNAGGTGDMRAWSFIIETAQPDYLINSVKTVFEESFF